MLQHLPSNFEITLRMAFHDAGNNELRRTLHIPATHLQTKQELLLELM